MEVLDPTMGTTNGLAVVGEEVEALFRMNYKLRAGGALKEKNCLRKLPKLIDYDYQLRSQMALLGSRIQDRIKDQGTNKKSRTRERIRDHRNNQGSQQGSKNPKGIKDHRNYRGSTK